MSLAISRLVPQNLLVMAWLRALDADLFHFVNLNLHHPALDGPMRFLSGNAFFAPVLILLAIWVLWKGGIRGRVMVLMLALIVPLGDGLVVNPLKHAIGRVRPSDAMQETQVVGSKGDGRSMPSAHVANWFAATLIAAVYYRRTWKFMVPLGCAVAFSRLYVGAHYPADVLVGAIVGAGYACAGVVLFTWLWQLIGKNFFPLWWQSLPVLANPDVRIETNSISTSVSRDQHWIRLGCLLIGLVFVGRLIFLASGSIELSKDEAYQWLWSKHLALSYYSKPPMIAYAQWLSTSIFGDTAFGVRFLSPLIGALLLLMVLFWIGKIAGGRTAFWLILIFLATPLLAVGSTLLTIDPLLVLFWTIAMVLGWRAVQPDGTLAQWLGIGLATGFAFLSKYSGLYLVVCFGIFFALWRPSRPQLRKPGPWLALLVMLVCTLPVIIWNAQRHWVTLSHLSENASLKEQWKNPLRHFGDFTGAELGLLNPIFLVGAIWALVAFWKEKPEPQASSIADPASRRGFMIYLFCMGAPVFLGHWLYTLHSQVQPNWIAPAVVPMFCLMVMYWERRWRAGGRGIVAWLCAGLALGLFAAIVLHEPKLVGKIVGQELPPEFARGRQLRKWSKRRARNFSPKANRHSLSFTTTESQASFLSTCPAPRPNRMPRRWYIPSSSPFRRTSCTSGRNIATKISAKAITRYLSSKWIFRKLPCRSGSSPFSPAFRRLRFPRPFPNLISDFRPATSNQKKTSVFFPFITKAGFTDGCNSSNTAICASPLSTCRRVPISQPRSCRSLPRRIKAALGFGGR